MGVYGDHSTNKEPKKTYAATGYNDEGEITYDKYSKSKTEVKADPFGWGESRPASQKFESYSKPKHVVDKFDDTGYDGWNDVKRSESAASKNVPDPYAKTQTLK